MRTKNLLWTNDAHKRIIFILFHLRNFNYLHIIIDQVLTSHTPDKGIVACTSCAVNRPLWSNHSLLVVQPDRTSLLWFTHYMENLLTLWHIVIEICLHTTEVSMSWHGVPYRTLFQLSYTHLQLTCTYTATPSIIN